MYEFATQEAFLRSQEISYRTKRVKGQADTYAVTLVVGDRFADSLGRAGKQGKESLFRRHLACFFIRCYAK